MNLTGMEHDRSSLFLMTGSIYIPLLTGCNGSAGSGMGKNNNVNIGLDFSFLEAGYQVH